MLNLYIDGSAKPNPGLGGIGFVGYWDDKKHAIEGYSYLGKNTTNNQAEFLSLIHSLFEVKEKFGCDLQINIYTDSELLYSVLTIPPKRIVKNIILHEYLRMCKIMMSQFRKVDIFHINRQENKVADNLASLAINNKKRYLLVFDK